MNKKYHLVSKEKMSSIQPDYNKSENYQHGFHDALQLITDLFPATEMPKQEWIGINDRMPELGTRCLIVESDGNIEICNYEKSFWNHPENSIGFLNEQDEQPSMCYPTHWQSLPEKPKTI